MLEETNVDKLSVEMSYVKEDVVELKSDVKELKNEVVNIKSDISNINNRLDNMINVINKIDQTIEQNKNKWNSRVNTWIIGAGGTAITIIITYLVNNFISMISK